MKKAQQGFTLIELVMVIVILGVLAAVAIPKFIDLKSDASQASVDGVAGALSSGSAINYAVYSAKGTATQVTTCSGAQALLQGGAFPTGGGQYSSTTTFSTTATGSVNACTLNFAPAGGTAVTASFSAIAVN